MAGINAGSVFVNLFAKTDDSGFKDYEKHLDRVERKTRERERFKAELGARFDNRAFNAYYRDVEKTQRQNESLIRSQGRVRTAFGSVWLRGGAAFAAAGGAYALVNAGKAVIASASDINESLSKNRVLFGQYAKEIDAFSRTSATSFGISRQAALEYTGVFGNLFVALGVAKDRSAGMSVQLTKLAADMASFNNASLEETLDAIRAGLVGETEPLRKFGVNLNDATLRQEAMALGLTKTTANVLTPYQKAMAAQALIVKQTEKAHGDFARTSGGLANQQRILKARISDLGAEIGAKLLPVALKATRYLNDFIDQMDRGDGVGGAFVSSIEALGHSFHGAVRGIDAMLGALSSFYDALHVSFELLSHLPGVLGGGSHWKYWADAASNASDNVDKVRDSLKLVADPIDDVDKRLGKMARGAKGHMFAIRAATRDAMAEVRDRMSGDTAKAQRAVDRNIDQAVKAIARGMKSGRIETGDGMGAIRDLMRDRSRDGKDALNQNFARVVTAIKSQLGRSENVTRDGLANIVSQMSDAASQFGVDLPRLSKQKPVQPKNMKAGGGWIGSRGQVGGDTVPAMLGVGEAVLNRHQQGVIEGLLGDGFLDRLFATVNRPHYLAKGGRVKAYADGGRVTGDTDYLPALGRALAAMSAAAGVPIFVQSGRRTLAEQAALVRQKGLYGPGNPTGAAAPSPNAPHVRGVAADITPGRSVFGALAARFGLGFTVPTEPWHIQWLGGGGGGGGGGAAAAVLRKLLAPKVSGGGTLGRVVQGALNTATSAANRNLASSFASGGFAGWLMPWLTGGRSKHKPRKGFTDYGVAKGTRLASGWAIVHDTGGNPIDLVPRGETLGKAGSRALAEIEMRQARAEVDTPDDSSDDIKWATALRDFWQNVYDDYGVFPGRAGRGRVTDAAQRLKAAREALASLSQAPTSDTPGPAEISPDAQAQIDQWQARAAALAGDLSAARNVITAFGSSGDMGMGGYVDAFQAASGLTPIAGRASNGQAPAAPNVIFQSYVPPSPQEALRLANYTVGGMALQPSVSSSKTLLGI